MKLDGYRLILGNTILVFKKIDDETKGKKRPCNQTPVWIEAEYYIDFYSSKDQRPDKIPLRKSVKALEKKLEKNRQLNIDDILSLGVIPGNLLPKDNFSSTDSGQFSQESAGSNSLGSISSQQFSEENLDVQQKPCLKKSRIPVKNNNTTLPNDNSLKRIDSRSSLSSITSEFSRIPISKDSSLLFKQKALKGNTDNKYEINKVESWILISPELLDLVKAKNLLKDTHSIKTNALTYRNIEKVRLINLNKKEISILEKRLPKLCKELESNERINFFRS